MKNKIVLVPFPFDDLSGMKVRPALYLTESISQYDHVIISFITSQLAKATEVTDIALLITDSEFIMTGLKLDSAIRLHRLITILKSLIQRQLGVLPSSYHTILETKLRGLFQL